MSEPLRSLSRIAYLGPQGTFSEEALLSEPDLAECEVVPTQTIAEAIAAAANGEVDAAFVPLENAIEGSINATLDQLDLRRRSHHRARGRARGPSRPARRAGMRRADGSRRVLLLPRRDGPVPEVPRAARSPTCEIVATNSTADAARIVAEDGSLESAAVSPPLAAKLYGLEVLSHAIEDHPGNQTRFVLVGRRPVSRADRTGPDDDRLFPAGGPSGQPRRDA